MVWDPHYQKDIMQLENVQRKALRFIVGKYKRLYSPRDFMKLNKIPTLEALNGFSFLHNRLTGKIRSALPTSIQRVSTRIGTYLRSHKSLSILLLSHGRGLEFFAV